MKQLHLHQRHIENSVHYPGLGLFLGQHHYPPCLFYRFRHLEQLHCFHHYPGFERLRCCKNYPNYHQRHIGNSVLRIEIDLFLDWSDCCCRRRRRHLHRFEQLHCFHHYPGFEGLRCCKSHLYRHLRHIGNSVLRIEIDLFLDWSDCCCRRSSSSPPL